VPVTDLLTLDPAHAVRVVVADDQPLLEVLEARIRVPLVNALQVLRSDPALS